MRESFGGLFTDRYIYCGFRRAALLLTFRLSQEPDVALRNLDLTARATDNAVLSGTSFSCAVLVQYGLHYLIRFVILKDTSIF